VEADKKTYNTLFFKNYLWVRPNNEKTASFDLLYDLQSEFKLPYDGVVLTDPFGTFVGFWKPWKTADVYVNDSPNGLYTTHSGSKYSVIDNKLRFVSPGVYEVYTFEGEIRIIQPRLEKDKQPGELPFHNTNDCFKMVDGKVDICGVEVSFPDVDIFSYMENYGRNYELVIKNLSSLNITNDQLVNIYLTAFHRLSTDYKLYDDYYTVSDFVSSMSTISTHNPQRLWQSFIKAGLMSGPGPFSPVVKVIGSVKAVIHKTDFIHTGPLISKIVADPPAPRLRSYPRNEYGYADVSKIVLAKDDITGDITRDIEHLLTVYGQLQCCDILRLFVRSGRYHEKLNPNLGLVNDPSSCYRSVVQAKIMNILVKRPCFNPPPKRFRKYDEIDDFRFS